MTTEALARAVAAAIVFAFVVGVLVYVGVSFVTMRAHTGKRRKREAVRAAIRELVSVALSQPLLPLFYFVGRKLADGGGAVPVVVVHGYMQNRIDFVRIASSLAKRGSGPVLGFNYPWFMSVPHNAARLARFVERVRRETGAAQVDLVCHSLGGLVGMEYLRCGGDAHVRRCVTIASPHAGVVWKGPILGACAGQLRVGCDYLTAYAAHRPEAKCLAIYSTHDNVVHPPNTSSLVTKGGVDHVVEGIGHLSILFEPEVARTVAHFVCTGTVDESAAAKASLMPPPDAPDAPPAGSGESRDGAVTEASAA